MTCLSSIKFNLIATVTRNYRENVFDNSGGGSFQDVYDELTGEVVKVWVAADLTPSIPGDGDDAGNISELPCSISPSYTVSQANDVRYNQGGARVVDTERLVMKVPSRYHLYTTDQVTAIRNRNGDLIFEDDQVPNMKPAIYNVTGVTPVMDPFGNVIERQVQLEKSNS